MELQSLYKQNLIDENIPASGDLVNSVQARVNVNGNNYQVVLSLEDYWKYIEYGRSPGKLPPPDKILRWVLSKPILPTEGLNGRIPTEKQLAFLIGRKIAKDGIQPKPILENTLSALYDQFIDRIAESFAGDVNENSFQIITVSLGSNNWKTIHVK